MEGSSDSCCCNILDVIDIVVSVTADAVDGGNSVCTRDLAALACTAKEPLRAVSDALRRGDGIASVKRRGAVVMAPSGLPRSNLTRRCTLCGSATAYLAPTPAVLEAVAECFREKKTTVLTEDTALTPQQRSAKFPALCFKCVFAPAVRIDVASKTRSKQSRGSLSMDHSFVGGSRVKKIFGLDKVALADAAVHRKSIDSFRTGQRGGAVYVFGQLARLAIAQRGGLGGWNRAVGALATPSRVSRYWDRLASARRVVEEVYDAKWERWRMSEEESDYAIECARDDVVEATVVLAASTFCRNGRGGLAHVRNLASCAMEFDRACLCRSAVREACVVAESNGGQPVRPPLEARGSLERDLARWVHASTFYRRFRDMYVLSIADGRLCNAARVDVAWRRVYLPRALRLGAAMHAAVPDWPPASFPTRSAWCTQYVLGYELDLRLVLNIVKAHMECIVKSGAM